MKHDLFTEYSDQLDNVVANPVVHNETIDETGKVRIAYFTLTATVALPADSVVGLVKIPADARIIGGAYQHSAFGAGVTIDVGIYGANGDGYYTGTTADDIDFFINGDDVSSAGQDTIAELAEGDLNANYATTKEVVLAVKILGDEMPLAGTLTGLVKYVVK